MDYHRREKKPPIIGSCLSCKAKIREGDEYRIIYYKNKNRKVHPPCLKNREIEEWNRTIREDGDGPF